jgi:hypothetical protein
MTNKQRKTLISALVEREMLILARIRTTCNVVSLVLVVALFVYTIARGS